MVLKRILQSVQYQICNLIVSNKKKYIISKTRPDILEKIFKVYIYCTKAGAPIKSDGGLARGSVIGEYICDEIQEICFDNKNNIYKISDDLLKLSCIEQDSLKKCGKGKTLYAWHISNLAIYDVPKTLDYYSVRCREYGKAKPKCGGCKYLKTYPNIKEFKECMCDGKKPLTKAPHSWCSVTLNGKRSFFQDSSKHTP